MKYLVRQESEKNRRGEWAEGGGERRGVGGNTEQHRVNEVF